MEEIFRTRLEMARRAGVLASIGVWICAFGDLAAGRPREWHNRWRRRGRVGLPSERRTVMFGSDLRYAWRSITHQKLGSGLVLAMLALGIGANVAVFSLVNGLFLRPFPFPEPDRLVYINETAPRWNLDMTGVRFFDFVTWRNNQQAFDAIALWNSRSFNVATEEGADRVDGAAVTSDFAKVLGIEPLLGRMFAPEEDLPNAPLVTVIGYALWQERFSGRADVLGKELRLNSRVHTIIGVLPQSAEFPRNFRLWIPMQGNPNNDEQSYSFDGIGRLKPAVTLEQANADLLRTHQPIFDKRDKDRVVTPFARDLREQLTNEFDTIISTLGAAVSLLLIVACANVAAMMLARALARRREVGIRLAVGASRVRLLKQLLVENLILSLVGGAIGLIVGHWAIQLLVGALPDQAPRWTTFRLDTRMVLFTLATCTVTALLFGWAPALHAMNDDVRGAVAASTAGSTPAIRGRRTLWALVVAEFALASLMFVCGGLLVRAYDRVRNVDPGFEPHGVLSFNVSLPGVKYADGPMRLAFLSRLEERVRSLPGVTRAGLISCAPLSDCHWGTLYHADGAPPRGPNDPNPIILNRVASAGYFATMGIRLKRGRFLTEQDGHEGAEKESVAIVNETFARTLWPDGKDPVGQRIRTGEKAPWLTVVGLVEDLKHYGLERDVRPGVYLPLPRIVLSTMTVALKTDGDPNALGPTVRAVVQDMDPELATFNMRTMEDRVALNMTLRAAYSWMLGVFAAIALVLALGGSYGVTSYLVSQRSRELGIRVALGAGRADISRTVLTGSLRVVAIGVVIGVAGAVGAGRWLSALLFGVPPYDAAILAVATLALFTTGFFASWLPARRAARVDPMVSLRSD